MMQIEVKLSGFCQAKIVLLVFQRKLYVGCLACMLAMFGAKSLVDRSK
jgi:hypothetical protein